MDGFAPRDKAIDYWFWKFHVDDLAVLVDVVIRRKLGTAEIRICLWQAGVPRVIHAETGEWVESAAEIVIGATTLRAGASTGGADDVRWDLAWSEGSVVVSPLNRLLARVEPFDTTVLTWPLARFDGWIEVGGRRFELRDVPGTWYHYWGRMLSQRWVWLSATSFEAAPGRRLEAIVAIRTRFLGGPTYPLMLGYLWSTDGERSDLTVSTINGLVRSREVPGGIAIDTVRLGGPRHHVTATWGSVVPIDIGEGIVQTMHADVVIDGHRAVPGTVGLETRAWPSVAAVAAMKAVGR